LIRQPQLDEGAWPRVLGLPHVEGFVSVRTNASAAHFYAVELGVGIGGLATYAQALGADVIPVDIGIRHQMDIWMTLPSRREKCKTRGYFYRLGAFTIRCKEISVVQRRIYSSQGPSKA
jgi:hypothetical protein